MTTADVELLYPSKYYEETPKPRTAARGELAAELFKLREYMAKRMRRELRAAGDQIALREWAGLAWDAYRVSFKTSVAPIILAEFGRGMRQAHTGRVPEKVLVGLADNYAETMGDYFNQSSTDAMIEGFNAYVNKKVPQKAAAERALDSYGLTRRQTRSVVAASDLEALKISTVRQLDPKRQIKSFIGQALRDRFKIFEEEELFRANQHARQLVWLYEFKQGRLPPGTRRIWITADDEKVCPQCGPLHNMRAPINEPFHTKDGDVWTPGLHVNCRCEVRLWVPTVTLVRKANGDDWDEEDERLHPRSQRTGRFVRRGDNGEPDELLARGVEDYEPRSKVEGETIVLDREDPFLGTTQEATLTPVAKPLTPVRKPLTPVAKPLTPVAKPLTPVTPTMTPAAQQLTSVEQRLHPVVQGQALTEALRQQTLNYQHMMEELATARVEQALERTVAPKTQAPKTGFVAQHTVNTDWEKNAHVELANAGYRPSYDWIEGHPHQPTFMVLREPMEFKGARTPWQQELGFDENKEAYRLMVQGTVYDRDAPRPPESMELSSLSNEVDEHGITRLVRWTANPDDERITSDDAMAISEAYDLVQSRLDQYGEDPDRLNDEFVVIPGIEVHEDGRVTRSAREFSYWEVVAQLGMAPATRQEGGLYARVFRVVTFDPRYAEPTGRGGDDLRINRGTFRVEDGGYRDGVQMYYLYAVDPMDD